MRQALAQPQYVTDFVLTIGLIKLVCFVQTENQNPLSVLKETVHVPIEIQLCF